MSELSTPATAPEGFTPYPWQRACARLNRPAFAVAAEAGAGKTYAAFLRASYLQARRILVIAPPGKVSRQWVAAAERWGCSARIVGGPKEGNAALHVALDTTLNGKTERPEVAVVPWSRLQRKQDAPHILAALEGIPPVDLLVLDESHYAQSPDAARGKVACGYVDRRRKRTGGYVKGLRHYARRVLALTGTPSTSDPKKVRAQMLFAFGDRKWPELQDHHAYERAWWGGRMQYDYGARREIWTTDDEPADGHDELVRETIFVVDSAELAKQMPPHRRLMVEDLKGGPVPDELVEWADACEAGDDQPMPPIEDLADLRREQTEDRLAEIVERVQSWDGETEPGRMLLIWCVYQDSADALRQAIGAKLDGTVASIHGGNTDSNRASTLADACAGRLRVLIATHASTGTGVDGLQTHAAHALVVEAPHTPGAAEQTEGRLVRTGQKRPVITEWVCSGIEAQIIRGIGLKDLGLKRVLSAATTLKAGLDDEPAGPVEEVRHRTGSAPAPDTRKWTWALFKRTGEWVVRCDHAGDETWPGQVVTVVNRTGKRTPVTLGAQQAGGQGWSLWTFTKVRKGVRS